jgi:hypothetical protein
VLLEESSKWFENLVISVGSWNEDEYRVVALCFEIKTCSRDF